MRIYKNLAPIRALSFDLDDTLYANPEVIARAELAMQQAIARQLPDFVNNTPKYWHQLRWQLAEQHPEIRHDVSQWRLTALEQGLTASGISNCAAMDIAQYAMDAFLEARTNIQLAPMVRPILQQLAARFPLIAITNGNANLAKMGIADLFAVSLRAGPDGRMKPFPDLFTKAARRLDLTTNQVLHIGDHPESDIVGALNAGCQTAWIDKFCHPTVRLRVLPHLAISELDQLLQLPALSQ